MRTSALVAALGLLSADAMAQRHAPPPGPLQAFELSQLRLKSVTLGKRPSAVLVDPKGTEHVVHKGDLVGKDRAGVVCFEKEGLVVAVTVAEADNSVRPVFTSFTTKPDAPKPHCHE